MLCRCLQKILETQSLLTLTSRRVAEVSVKLI